MKGIFRFFNLESKQVLIDKAFLEVEKLGLMICFKFSNESKILRWQL